MGLDRQRIISSLYNSALAHEGDDRARFLREACPDDGVRAEIESLLEYEQKAEQFLEGGALSILANTISQNMDTTSPLIGRLIGSYEILALIGAGGMGRVYRARDTRLGREVAVKFLSKEFSQDRAAIARFQREARIASSLDHPNICAVHDVGEYDDQPFIVMPLLHGQSLDDRLTAHRLKVDDIVEYGIQIADALVAAHARGILHCDIKPANIFVTERNEPKLLDFGVAKLAAVNTATAAQETDMHRTDVAEGPALLAGTVAYMSPEQGFGEEQDARSEIFSLGVTLYEIATGTLPFKGPTPAAVFNAIISQTPTGPSAINSEIPPDLDRLIGRALEKDRALRYQTASDLLADLKRVRRDLQSMKKQIVTEARRNARP